jgi:curved DNA-binding protein CbpA
MHLNDDPLSLYDVLELTPDATPQEIRSAYLRLKSAYGKDNIAHYTVFSREETEQMLQNIENAYLTLSNPERRRNYDQNQGLSQTENAPGNMSTDFFGSPQTQNAPQSSPMGMMEGSAGLAAMTTAMTHSTAQKPASQENQLNDLELIIQNETQWNGAALRRIREARRITLEDLSDYTRISRTYLQALEDDDFNKLPALVYVRGFLQQVSRRLKLPADTVSQVYLSRLKSARPDK